ncbi:MAG: S-methyl-5-thioribose-1-phosphate isomerase [Candidatus Zixiibacteriota bacterium]
MFDPIKWENSQLILLDQTKLPNEEKWLRINKLKEVEKAIKILSIRGAPNLGVAALYGAYIGIMNFNGNYEELGDELDIVCSSISKTRPTAHDLFAALEIAQETWKNAENADDAKSKILQKAHSLKEQLQERSKIIGEYGAEVVPEGANILTHCNTGTLAAPGDGTAFSVIAEAHRQEKVEMVYADETRPLLQGARLTIWELQKRNIPCKLNVDSAAGYLMATGKIDFIVTGADRIALNGDAANKIGTYMLAVLAKHNNIPFYIAAPTNTFDKNLKTGKEIEIELRENKELNSFGRCQTAPDGTDGINPAFDVTPIELIDGIITEEGILFRKD